MDRTWWRRSEASPGSRSRVGPSGASVWSQARMRRGRRTRRRARGARRPHGRCWRAVWLGVGRWRPRGSWLRWWFRGRIVRPSVEAVWAARRKAAQGTVGCGRGVERAGGRGAGRRSAVQRVLRMRRRGCRGRMTKGRRTHLIREAGVWVRLTLSFHLMQCLEADGSTDAGGDVREIIGAKGDDACDPGPRFWTEWACAGGGGA